MSTPRLSVMVCHDCCCGTRRKHPGIDHQELRDQLHACASETLRVRTVDCLDECDQSNVVLVRDHRRGGQRDLWLGGLHSTQATGALTTWLTSGGEFPASLIGHVFRHRPPPGRRSV